MILNLMSAQAEIREKGDKILITCQYLPKLVAELKECEGYRYENIGGVGFHSVRRNSRSLYTIDFISKGIYNASSAQYKSALSGLLPKRDLWNHQIEAFRFKVTRKRCIDAGEMGIGKTLSTFEAIESFRNMGWQGGCWWIAPNSALTSYRTQSRKFKFALRPGDVLSNYHALEERMVRAEVPPQIVVFDESSFLKNAGARRTQLAISLSNEMEKYWGNECSVILMTGTPAPQSPFDWWSQCETARPGWFRESNIHKFQRRLADYGVGERSDGGSYPVFLGFRPRELDRLPNRLQGLVLVKWKKDCLDLPEKLYEEYQCNVDPTILRLGRFVCNSTYSALQIQQKLRQLSDGFQYDSDAGWIETGKDVRLQELLEEYQDYRRVVIYAAYTESIDKLSILIEKAGWNVWRYDGRGSICNFAASASRAEEIFQHPEQNPQPIAFLGNPEAAGMGLTLTPSPVVIFYSNSFKSQYRIQAEDRIHRPGATKGCKIIDLIHLPTDKLVLDKLKAKRDVEVTTLEEIMEAITAVS